jgi:hypothetical protein
MTHAESIAEGERILAQDHSEKIGSAEISKKMPYPTPPISLRLSAPLLESLERLAIKQHRKRAGLIQHILWEYVFAHEGVTAGLKAPPKTKKPAVPANGEKIGRPKARALKA